MITNDFKMYTIEKIATFEFLESMMISPQNLLTTSIIKLQKSGFCMKFILIISRALNTDSH